MIVAPDRAIQIRFFNFFKQKLAANWVLLNLLPNSRKLLFIRTDMDKTGVVHG